MIFFRKPTFYFELKNISAFLVAMIMVGIFYYHPLFRTDIAVGVVLNWIYPIPFFLLGCMSLFCKAPKQFKKEQFKDGKIGEFLERYEGIWIILTSTLIIIGMPASMFGVNNIGDFILYAGIFVFFLPFILIFISPVWKKWPKKP